MSDKKIKQINARFDRTYKYHTLIYDISFYEPIVVQSINYYLLSFIFEIQKL